MLKRVLVAALLAVSVVPGVAYAAAADGSGITVTGPSEGSAPGSLTQEQLEAAWAKNAARIPDLMSRPVITPESLRATLGASAVPDADLKAARSARFIGGAAAGHWTISLDASFKPVRASWAKASTGATPAISVVTNCPAGAGCAIPKTPYAQKGFVGTGSTPTLNIPGITNGRDGNYAKTVQCGTNTVFFSECVGPYGPGLTTNFNGAITITGWAQTN